MSIRNLMVIFALSAFVATPVGALNLLCDGNQTRIKQSVQIDSFGEITPIFRIETINRAMRSAFNGASFVDGFGHSSYTSSKVVDPLKLYSSFVFFPLQETQRPNLSATLTLERALTNISKGQYVFKLAVGAKGFARCFKDRPVGSCYAGDTCSYECVSEIQEPESPFVYLQLLRCHL